MNPEVLFSAANLFALAGWMLLAALPRWKWTDRLVLSGGFSLVLAGLYLVLLVRFFGSSEGGFQSLEQVSKLFQQPYLLLAGWVHYLAFDLFVGCWEVRDARHRGVPHWLVLPCLALTFLFGPVGLLAYYGVRSFARKSESKKDA
jgi:Domain of unknown function (DUF4281)